MAFRNHRNKIKAYRASGKMFGQTFCTLEAHARVEKREALGREFETLHLKGHWPSLSTDEIETAIAMAKGK